MSSIIAALKKSDQSRNNDNHSDLNNIKFSDNHAPKSRRGFWWLIVLLLLLTFAVYAWQQGWHNRFMPVIQSSTLPNETKPVNENAQPANVEPVLETKQPSNTRLNQLNPPKQSEIKAQTEQVQKLKATPATAEIKPVEPKPNNEENKTTNNRAVPSSEVGEVQNQILPVKQEENNQIKTNKPLVAVDKKKTEPAKDPSLQPKLQQDYLLIHQIDFAVRKDIPEIKINIHIYDPEPDSRMVLINGERFNIGDAIEESVSIVDIVPEGIVVAYDNIQFLIPK